MNRTPWADGKPPAGAMPARELAEHFGDPALECDALNHTGIIVHDSGLGVLRVRGPDHRRFLHAQLTCDVEGLPAGESQLGAWLTPKGQVLHLLTLLARPDGIDLVLPAAQAADLGQRLRRYILRAKVAIDDGLEGKVALGLAGPLVPATLGEAASTYSTAGVPTTEIELWALPGHFPRYLVLGAEDALSALAGSLRANLRPASRQAWHVAALEAGVPAIDDQTRERYIPQMLDLDRLGAVSFGKGCYPGQEIVARTRYLGRLKRRLYRLRFEGPAPDVLAALTRSGDPNVKEGEIVDREKTGDDGGIALAVASIERASAELDLAVQGELQRVTLEPVSHGGDADFA